MSSLPDLGDDFHLGGSSFYSQQIRTAAWLFDSGFDTFEISKALHLPEPVIVRFLHAIRNSKKKGSA